MVGIQNGRVSGSPGIFLEQRKQVVERGLDILATCSVVRFNRNQALTCLLDGGAWFALSPAPAPRNHQFCLIRENHLARLRMILCACAQFAVTFRSIGKMHRHRPLQAASLKDRHRQSIADTHKITQIDQQINARQIPFFRQTAQKSFGSAAVLCWIYPKSAKRTPPCRQRLNLAQRSTAESLQSTLLLVLKKLPQRGWSRTIRHISRQNSSTHNLRIPRQNIRVILENNHFISTIRFRQRNSY